MAVAAHTGIEFLARTTRDEPDYDVLMKGRLKALAEHGVGMEQIMEVVGALAPLEGAVDFLDELRARTQVLLLSDTFEQFARPLMAYFGHPTILCHRLVIEGGVVADYALRLPDQKRSTVEAFQRLNFSVVAAGDSYNDITMLSQADVGMLFRAPHNVRVEFPRFPAHDTYEDLLAGLTAALAT